MSAAPRIGSPCIPVHTFGKCSVCGRGEVLPLLRVNLHGGDYLCDECLAWRLYWAIRLSEARERGKVRTWVRSLTAK